MKATRTMVMFLLAVILSGVACANPTMTASVSQANGYKTYTYTLIGSDLTNIAVMMSNGGGASVINAACSIDGWSTNKSVRDETRWSASRVTGAQAASSVTLTLTTLDSAPTTYSYTTVGVQPPLTTNWSWHTLSDWGYGYNRVPVPTVPEPSSILALVGGLICLVPRFGRMRP